MYCVRYIGALGVICSIMWHFLVYDSPAEHPRIRIEERQFIEKALDRNVDEQVCKLQNKFEIKFYATFIRNQMERKSNQQHNS